MLKVRYYGQRPELVKNSWDESVASWAPVRRIYKEGEMWEFQFYDHLGVILLSSREIKTFLDNLGDEAIYVDFLIENS